MPLPVPPYGDRLVDLVVSPLERPEIIERASRLRSLQLSPRSLCDFELLATGGFSPLDRFMGEADYAAVIDGMRLANGMVFPIPVMLPIADTERFRMGEEIAIRSPMNDLLGVMTIEEVYLRDPARETLLVFGTTDAQHPLVAEMHGWGRRCLSGPLSAVALPRHYDFVDLRRTPRQVRAELDAMGYRHVVAFQTRNPLHRAHEELTKRAAAAVGGSLLIHPVVGMTKPGDVDHFTRVRGYRAIVDQYYDRGRTLLSLLPLAMRMAGPREAVWHAIVRRNFGASHFIVGRDHAGPGHGSDGRPFYEPLAAQELALKLSAEIGVGILPFEELVYVPDTDSYEEARTITPTTRTASLSGTQVRTEYLARGRPLPTWFTRPENATILAKSSPPLHERGFAVWFTGLSGAGKSTIAEILTVMLLERGRQVTVLDGDVVRTHLSKGLGFSKEDRDTNIRRIGYVASEVVRHNGITICAAVSPYEATRQECRNMIGTDRFILVYVNTPLDVCEQRDAKGMYARARRGEIKGFTGIDDPYEPPREALVLTTTDTAPEENARQIVSHLEKLELVLPEGVPSAPVDL